MSVEPRAVTVLVTDFGPWRPEDARQAAALIGVVNEHRRPQDSKPRVTLWGDGQRCLEGQIDDWPFSVEPGEHLVRSVLPDGSEEWGGLSADYLAKLDTSDDDGES